MTESNPIRILLVEDDELAATILAKYLEKQGFAVECEPRGDAAVDRILANPPAVVILDANLPGRDGFEVCREVRARYRGPIVMLTARIDDIDQVLGLELGADDYITKPAEPRVVLAHIKACLRRIDAAAAAPGEITEYRYGRFHIDRTARAVYLGGQELPFTTAEFDLLWLLASGAGTILSRDEILHRLRGIGHDGLDRSIDMRISRLRKRLGDDIENPHLIKTVRGQGYLFDRRGWD